MKLDKNQQAFLTLLKAGLWEKEARLLMLGAIRDRGLRSAIIGPFGERRATWICC